MEQFTFDELVNKIHHGEEGSLQLNWDDCCALQKILLKRGYAVLITGGDIGDDYRIDWVYAGSTDNLKYADRTNVCFSSSEYLEMLIYNDYKEDEE